MEYQLTFEEFFSSNNNTNYVKELVLIGSLFRDGKKRIIEMFTEAISKQERIKKIKKEYGLGGASWKCRQEYGICAFDTYKNKDGITYQVRQYDDSISEHVVTWPEIHDEIERLIIIGEYKAD